MSRCPDCGQKECCGASMSIEIERLAQELADAREAFLSIEQTHRTEIELHNGTKEELAQAKEQLADLDRLKLCEKRLKAMTVWLEAEQPDVFRRGLWDAINDA